MLIGPVTDGALLEIGILDLEGEDAVVTHAMPARPRQAVQIARGHGHSWNRIAVALGVSRQAAWQRYAEGTGA